LTLHADQVLFPFCRCEGFIRTQKTDRLWWSGRIRITARLNATFSLAVRGPDIWVHHGFCDEASIGR